MFDATYNITNIQDGKIEVDIKIAGGKRMALSDIVKRYGAQLWAARQRQCPGLRLKIV